MSTPQETFLRDGICTIDLSTNATAYIPRVIEQFKAFLKEDRRYCDQWTFLLGGVDEPDDGFVRKEGAGQDQKYYMHYRPHLPTLLAKRGVDCHQHEAFLETLGTIYRCMHQEMQRFIHQLHDIEPSLNLPYRNRRFDPFNVLRILYYDAASKGARIGKEHPDKSTLTFHLLDSEPGLMLGNNTSPYVGKPNTAVVFAGSRMERLTKKRIKAVRHSVIATNENSNRWAVVFFAYC